MSNDSTISLIRKEVTDAERLVWMRCVRIVSVIIAVVSLAFGIFTFFRNRQLESEKREQTHLFLEASQRFTKELDEQKQALRATTSLLAEMSRKLNETHRRLVEEHRQMAREYMNRVDQYFNSGDAGATMGANRRTAAITTAMQSLWR